MQNFKFKHEGEQELSAVKMGFAVGSWSLDSLLSGLILLLAMMKDNKNILAEYQTQVKVYRSYCFKNATYAIWSLENKWEW